MENSLWSIVSLETPLSKLINQLISKFFITAEPTGLSVKPKLIVINLQKASYRRIIILEKISILVSDDILNQYL